MARKRVPLEQKITKNGKINGRPPDWTDELIENEADELIKWADYDDSIMLTAFCCERVLFEEDISQFARNNTKFAQSLKYAKMKIAKRREEMVNKEQLNYGVYQRYQAMYDPFIYKHERAEKAYEAELKKQIVAGGAGSVTLNITDYGK